MNLALEHWSASWPILLAWAAAAALHLDGLAGLLRDGAAPRRQLEREAAVFQAGLLTAVLALVSPLGYWSAAYIWVRSIQDLTLAFVAPALLVLGAPWLALGYRWSRRDGQAGGRPGAGASPGRAAGPVVAVVAVNVVWLAWHVPAAYDRSRGSGGLGAAEHVTYLGAGIVFWLQLIGSRPYRPRATPLRRMALIVGTVLAGTVLGMVLVFGSGVLYPAYGGAGHHVMTVLDDQQLAGAVLWMGMLPPLIIAAVTVVLSWLRDEEAAETSAGLDRLLARPRSSWPSGPGRR
jgi:putative membrane protein